jgi:hypothetical protein
MRIWEWTWGIWLALVFVSFGVLEGLGLSQKINESLSDTTWRWFDIVGGQPISQWTLPHLLAFVVLLALAIVLVLHLGLGLFR